MANKKPRPEQYPERGRSLGEAGFFLALEKWIDYLPCPYGGQTKLGAMAKVGHLEELSFSHEAALAFYQHEELVAFPNLDEVVSGLERGECDCALIPFFNSNGQYIQKALSAFLPKIGRFFVSGHHNFEIRLFVGGYGGLDEVTTFRTIEPVFAQATSWMSKNKPMAIKENEESTVAAVRSLKTNEPHVAAIGTLSACNAYSIPVLADEIQNNPNNTCFWVVTRELPDIARASNVLMCLKSPADGEKEDIMNEPGVRVPYNGPFGDVWLFQISPVRPGLDVSGLIDKIRLRNGTLQILGAYSTCLQQAIQTLSAKLPNAVSVNVLHS